MCGTEEADPRVKGAVLLADSIRFNSITLHSLLSLPGRDARDDARDARDATALEASKLLVISKRSPNRLISCELNAHSSATITTGLSINL